MKGMEHQQEAKADAPPIRMTRTSRKMEVGYLVASSLHGQARVPASVSLAFLTL